MFGRCQKSFRCSPNSGPNEPRCCQSKVSRCAVGGEIVEVEVGVSQELAAFAVVGVPDEVVREATKSGQEARERVRSKAFRARRNRGRR